MKNCKVILSLIALIAANNACALSSTDESFLKNMVGKKELSTQQISRIQKFMGDPKAAKIIEQITAKNPVVAAQLEGGAVEAPVAVVASPTAPATKEITTKTAAVTKPVATKMTSTLSSTDKSFLNNMIGKKELQPAQIARIQRFMGNPEADAIIEKITAKSPVIAAQLGEQPIAEPAVTTAPAGIPGAMAAKSITAVGAFPAFQYYDPATGSLNEEGIYELVNRIKTESGLTSNVQLIKAAYNAGVKYLQELRNETTLPSNVTDDLRNRITSRINVLGEVGTAPTMGKKLVGFDFVKSADNPADFMDRTKMDLRVFYDKKSGLQQNWFNELARITSQFTPTASRQDVQQVIRNVATEAFKLVRNTSQLDNKDKQAIETAINMTTIVAAEKNMPRIQITAPSQLSSNIQAPEPIGAKMAKIREQILTKPEPTVDIQTVQQQLEMASDWENFRNISNQYSGVLYNAESQTIPYKWFVTAKENLTKFNPSAGAVTKRTDLKGLATQVILSATGNTPTQQALDNINNSLNDVLSTYL